MTASCFVTVLSFRALRVARDQSAGVAYVSQS